MLTSLQPRNNNLQSIRLGILNAQLEKTGRVGEDSWESCGLQGDPTSPFWRRSTLGFLWKEWCWSWNSSTLTTSCEELTHWKGLWCWEGLGAGGEGDDRGWDGWMASLTWWTWVSVNSRSWWWTGRPGVLGFMGSQRVGLDWVTDLIWCLNDESFPGKIAGAHFQTSWLLQAFATWVTLLCYMNWGSGGFVLLIFNFVISIWFLCEPFSKRSLA